MASADRALYEAKEQGKNCIYLADPVPLPPELAAQGGGLAEALTELARRIEAALAPSTALTVVATVGMAGAIAPLVPRFDHRVPDLILDGLRILDELNRRPR